MTKQSWSATFVLMIDTIKKSGSHSLEGFEYQRDVSVWLGLTLLVTKQSADRLIIEAPNEEDLEAGVKSSEIPVAGSEMPLDNYTLSIQVKTKSTGPWKIADIKSLVAHGKKRPSVIKQLKDKDRRYLLITDAALDRVARDLGIKIPLQFSKKIPSSITKLTGDVSGRLAVLPSLDREKLNARIESLLTKTLKVPVSNWCNCYKAMGEHVFELMRQGGLALEKQELLKLIKDHGGYLGGFAEADLFVPPSNIETFRSVLKERNALLIRGPSGTGKTWLARKLTKEVFSDRREPLTYVKVEGGPAQVRAYQSNEPVLFDIEDPWGKYNTSPNSADWAGSLGDLMRGATPDRKFIVTSRSDLFEKAKPTNLESFIIPLKPKHYTQRARSKMFNHRLESLPLQMKEVVHDNREQSYRELETPLEIEKFFGLLRDPRPDDTSEFEFVRNCLQEAKTDVIEDRLVLHIREQKTENVAALVWGLLQAFSSFELKDLPDILWTLQSNHSEVADEAGAFISRLIAKHSIRLREGKISYRHNLDEKGLRIGFEGALMSAQRILSELASFLIIHEYAKHRSAGHDLAAAIEADDKLSLRLSETAQKRLEEDMLALALVATPKTGESAFDRLAKLSRAKFIPGQLALWLTYRNPGKKFWDLNKEWKPIEDDDSFYTKMKADKATAALSRAYVEHVLPSESWGGITGFVERVYRLDPEIGETFRRAATDNLESSRPAIYDILVDGALVQVEACDSLIKYGLSHYSTLCSAPLLKPHEEWEWINNVMDEEYIQHVSESAAMDLWTSEILIKSYIALRREAGDWVKLKSHIDTPEGMYLWIGEINKSDVEASATELAYLLEAYRKHGNEAKFWRDLQTIPGKVIGAEARAVALCETGGELRNQALTFWVTTGLWNPDAFLLDLQNTKSPENVVETVYALVAELGGKKAKEMGEALLTRLEGASRQVADALFVKDKTIAESKLVLSYQLDNKRMFNLALVNAAGKLGHDPCETLVAALRAETGPTSEDRHYVDAVVKVAVDFGCVDALQIALHHKHSIAIATSVRHLHPNATAFPVEFKHTLQDQSRDVLDAVYERIGAIGQAECASALVELVFNEAWTVSPVSPEGHLRYACRAADALIESEIKLSATDLDHILERACEARNFDLSQKLLQLLLLDGGPDYARRIFDRMQNEDRGSDLAKLCASSLGNFASTFDLSDLDRNCLITMLGQRDLHVSSGTAFLIGRILPEDRLQGIIDWLGQAKNRPLLLLPLAYGMVHRGEVSKWRAAFTSLGPELTAKAVKAMDGGEKLSPKDVDGIGYIGVRKHLANMFAGRIFTTKDEQKSSYD